MAYLRRLCYSQQESGEDGHKCARRVPAVLQEVLLGWHAQQYHTSALPAEDFLDARECEERSNEDNVDDESTGIIIGGAGNYVCNYPLDNGTNFCTKLQLGVKLGSRVFGYIVVFCRVVSK